MVYCDTWAGNNGWHGKGLNTNGNDPDFLLEENEVEYDISVEGNEQNGLDIWITYGCIMKYLWFK